MMKKLERPWQSPSCRVAGETGSKSVVSPVVSETQERSYLMLDMSSLVV